MEDSIGRGVVVASPGRVKTALVPLDKSKTIYSPRWIISVKRETDKHVKEFLVGLMSPELQGWEIHYIMSFFNSSFHSPSSNITFIGK